MYPQEHILRAVKIDQHHSRIRGITIVLHENNRGRKTTFAIRCPTCAFAPDEKC